MLDALLMVLLFLSSVFLILLVLVQRGRGGGLAGAFGGLGGQSAFGTKAGDLFTRVTIGTATFWIILCAFSVKHFSEENAGILSTSLGGATAPARAKAGVETPPAKSPEGSGSAPSGSGEPAAPAPTGPALIDSTTPAGEPANPTPATAPVGSSE